MVFLHFMNNIKRLVFSILFSAVILFVQGGFYLIHEHSLEVLKHQCSHNGEHESDYSEDCDACEFFSNQHFALQFGLQLETPQFFEIQESVILDSFAQKSFAQNHLRGPPTPA